MIRVLLAASLLSTVPAQDASENERPRPRDRGVVIGTFDPGRWNAITDVPGVRVGHATLSRGETVRTGVTVVLPHGGNPFREKVPCALFTMNGYGKLAGATQIAELGELESPIALTGTLNVPRVADALIDWVLALPGNAAVRSVNVVVGETNDGLLSDVRARPVGAAEVAAALERAASGPVAGGSVGAGTGTVCLGFKGGIGTASRRVGDHTVGVLVQTNFGGRLTVAGHPVWRELARPDGRRRDRAPDEDDGSCMIVVATDAPLLPAGLERLAKRAIAGMARTGAAFSNGSGDYVLAFCTAEALRITADAETTPAAEVLRGGALSPLFVAVAEATEEAILDSLFRATTTTGNGRTVEALPVERVVELLSR